MQCVNASIPLVSEKKQPNDLLNSKTCGFAYVKIWGELKQDRKRAATIWKIETAR
jgi:hypothetical protein